MSEYGPTYNEIDDYIAELTDEEREELATADAAIELAFLFHDAREARGLTQAEAARRAGLRQQAVSRFEQPEMKLANTKVETLRKYLTALGYIVGLSIKDAASGTLVKKISFEPTQNVGLTVAQTTVGQPFVVDRAGKTAGARRGFNRDARIVVTINEEGGGVYGAGLWTAQRRNAVEANSLWAPQYQDFLHGNDLPVLPALSAYTGGTVLGDPAREATGHETVQRGAA